MNRFATVALLFLLSAALVVAADDAPKPQVFKDYGFSITPPEPLIHEPTTEGKDTNGKLTKIDVFITPTRDYPRSRDYPDGNSKVFMVRVETFSEKVDAGVDYDYLDAVLKILADEHTKVGRADHFMQQGSVPAVTALFTITNDDGSRTYSETTLMIKGNRMYILRVGFLKWSEGLDLDSSLFFDSFKLL